MKKVTHQLSKRLATLTCHVASTGAGLASTFGWHQPKVPKKLVK